MGVDWTPERLRICQVRVTPGFLFVAALLLYQSTPSFLVTFLLAAALHEGGHLLAARWRGVPVRALSMTAFGCVLDFADGALVRDKDLLCIAAAGPLCNLLFALACMTPWVGQWHGAALFGAEHLLLALFNLLPVFPLDGAVLCAGLLRPRLGERRAEPGGAGAVRRIGTGGGGRCVVVGRGRGDAVPAAGRLGGEQLLAKGIAPPLSFPPLSGKIVPSERKRCRERSTRRDRTNHHD